MRLRSITSIPDARARDDALGVIGWPVRTLMDDRHAGRLVDFLVDATDAIRYAVLELGDGAQILIPIGLARVGWKQECVWLPGLALDHLGPLARYGGDPDAVDRAAERRLVRALHEIQTGGSHGPHGATDADRAVTDDDPRFSAQEFFGPAPA